ncbi:DNA polymerase IV [Methylococcaceae bacterium WWC4]|nr:DNA polymerase IV [Methylococcaceae bacterium WWC4]
MTEVPRKIIHIDMDAFYAAVEQRDHPQYRNKPVIVGGQPDSRGVVATCSYEARVFGVHSAMPSSQAYRLCPQAIFVRPRFDVYRAVSAAIRAIFARYCDCIEPLSLDEAYLDVSSAESAMRLAGQIKQAIRRETGLIASAGVSYNKFLAKIASDLGKPDGLHLITPEQGPAFVETLAVGKFHGIGPATERKMQALGILTGLDLKKAPLVLLQHHFGKAAQHYHDIARGVDHRPVRADRQRKSVGVETTFERDVADAATQSRLLQALFSQALLRLTEKQMTAYTLTVKIKYRNFVQVTRARTLDRPIADDADTRLLLAELLHSAGTGSEPVRLLGVTLSGLDPERSAGQYRQLDLFEHL